jgi:hypothetical protein
MGSLTFVNCRVSKYQARESAIAWITKGALGFPDAEQISADSITLYLTQFIEFECYYASEWTAYFGELDPAAYQRAQNEYRALLAIFRRNTPLLGPRRKPPSEPVRSNYVQWFGHRGVATGKWRSGRVLAGDTRKTPLPDEFRLWATTIARSIELERPRTGFMRSFFSASIDAWSNASIREAPQTLEPMDSEALVRSQFPLVDVSIETKIRGQLPALSKELSYTQSAVAGDAFRWAAGDALFVPLYVVRYRVPKGSYFCVVDGLDATLVEGQRARDLGGSVKRAWSSMFSASNVPDSPMEYYRRAQEADQRNDLSEAVSWYRKAAKADHAMAQSYLGSLCLEGRGVPKDTGEAAHWFRRAADRGNVAAQHALGVCYRDGLGVPRDFDEAKRWLRIALERGANAAEDIAQLEEEEKAQQQREREQREEAAGRERRRQEEEARRHGQQDNSRQQNDDATGFGDGGMDRKLALEILDLKEGASREQIEAAYKRMMIKNHPDAGGSNYIAKQLNAAREALLGKR